MSSQSELALQHLEDIQGYRITPNKLPTSEVTDQGLHLFSPEALKALYRTYSLSIGYQTDMGVLHVPVAGNSKGEVSDLIKVCNEKSQKIVHWNVERENLPPELPAVEPDTSDQKLLRKIVVPFAPVVLGDGRTRLFNIQGTYINGLR